MERSVSEQFLHERPIISTGPAETCRGGVDERQHLVGMSQKHPIVLGGVAHLNTEEARRRQREQALGLRINNQSCDTPRKQPTRCTRLQSAQEGVFVDGAVHAVHGGVVLRRLHGQVPACTEGE